MDGLLHAHVRVPAEENAGVGGMRPDHRDFFHTLRKRQHAVIFQEHHGLQRGLLRDFHVFFADKIFPQRLPVERERVLEKPHAKLRPQHAQHGAV